MRALEEINVEKNRSTTPHYTREENKRGELEGETWQLKEGAKRGC